MTYLYSPSLTEAKIAHLLSLAYANARRSPDPSSQVGVLIYSPSVDRIIGNACNTFPFGLEVEVRHL